MGIWKRLVECFEMVVDLALAVAAQLTQVKRRPTSAQFSQALI
jgi:hypothetical protein